MHKWSKGKILNVFANCQIVKGAKRAIICDLSRREFYLIPNSLADVMILFNGYTKERIYSEYPNTEKQTLMEYFEFLENREFIFWSDEDEAILFSSLNLNFRIPYIISNAILDLSEEPVYNIDSALKQLEQLNCPHIQIRFYYPINIEILTKICQDVAISSFRSIEIISIWENTIELSEIERALANAPKFINLDFYCKEMPTISSISPKILFHEKYSLNELHCGVIHKKFFASNITLFTEAQHHNTCLNRKISIDVNGEIKNCPSMAKSYGNIKDTTLAEAIEKPGFKDLWDINKDKIHVCKDCEFRYICTDCRAYIENPEDIYSKPLKCGYNPYTAEWEEWSTNPLKQKAIEYYGMQELVKKEPK
jgi:SPASM domain peptide maturase of grasp-with-spasm system